MTYLSSLDAEAVTAALERDDLPPDVRRVLEIRSTIGSASVKKLYAIENQTSADDRLRGLILHHGARTGRPTGRGPQPLNLPKAGPQLATCVACGRPHGPAHKLCPWCAAPAHPAPRLSWKPEMVDPVLEIMATRSLAAVEFFFGDAVECIMGCVRGLFQAGEGKRLIASDYSAIEAVVAACGAGEQWRIDTFNRKEDIYLRSASAITGTPYEAYIDYKKQHGDNHPDRQKIGKIAELALGFMGWVGAWKAFDKKGGRTDAEIADLIKKWRAASPRIVAIAGGQTFNWQPCLHGIEGAAIQAIELPGVTFTAQPPPGMAPFPVEIPFVVEPYGNSGHNALFMTLPSGRRLTYHKPFIGESGRPWAPKSIKFWTENTNAKYGPLGWVVMDTYAGRLWENWVQAVAHDIQRHGIELCKAAGYPMVLGVYDEDIFEVPEDFGSVEEVERLMATMPSWAQGWPIRASDGWAGKRYRKG